MAPEDPRHAAAAGPVERAWAHRESLLAYARRILRGDPHLAEDVVQEAYLRLHEEAGAGRAVGDERPWLFRVTRNLALDERRRARSREAVQVTLEAAPPEPRGPLERLQLAEAARNTLDEIDRLPPGERRVLLLDQAGMAPSAIARVTRTTTNAVHQSLFRARRRLRAVRSAAWGLMPIPLARLLLHASDAPLLGRLPSGSGDGLAGPAALVVAAALAGGGALLTVGPSPSAAPPRAGHVRGDARAAAVGDSTPSATSFAAEHTQPVSVAARRRVALVVSRPAPRRATPRLGSPEPPAGGGRSDEPGEGDGPGTLGSVVSRGAPDGPVEVPDDVGEGLEADGDADHVVGDPGQ